MTESIRFLSFLDMLNHDKSVWLESKSSEERKSIFGQWNLELLAAVQTWSQSLEDGAFKTHGQCMADKQSERYKQTYFISMTCKHACVILFDVFSPVSLLTKQVLPMIMKWEWGTTRNFLYQYQGEKTDLFSN